MASNPKQYSTSALLLMASSATILLATFLLIIPVSTAQSDAPIVSGLSWNFYESTCPKAEAIVRKELKKAFKKDIGLAAGLLRIHFHDCFVQGCDGSVLLDGTTNDPSEKQSPPNLTLRPTAFALIDKLRELVHKKCGQVVSCADIATIAARDAVYLSGGPDYGVPLGRRDSLTFASNETTLDNLPPPTSLTSELITALASKNLDPTDIVALSGGHTIGIAHCTSFTNRLYPQDTVNVMDQTFARNLKITCPTASTDNTTVNDIRSPNKFDNKYYVDLMNRQGLFSSDQTLYTDSRTRGIVRSFALDQGLFYQKFEAAMLKMGQLGVLTGNQGEVRAKCTVRNSRLSYVAEIAEEAAEIVAGF